MAETATSESLRKTLYRIDGRGYKAYRDVAGTYRFAEFTLAVDYVQGGPIRSAQPVESNDPKRGSPDFLNGSLPPEAGQSG